MFQKQPKKGDKMSFREEIKNDIENLKYKFEKMNEQTKHLQNLFEAWKFAYTTIESDFKFLKQKLKDF